MATVRFSRKLAQEYITLYRSLEIKPDKHKQADQVAAVSLRNKARYRSVAKVLKVPWYLIAAIHNLESGQNFRRHLHNGDPLTARTLHVPSGRPVTGLPPFTWEESAIALRLKNLHKVADWSPGRLFYELERYNGWGYRRYHPETLSPYLWSYSNHYRSGKYVADGRYSETAVSRQFGGAVLIRRLEEMDAITTSRKPRNPIYYYSNSKRRRAIELQRFLNGHDGIHLRVDGAAGKKTSSAYFELFGQYLQRDSREVPR